MILYCGSKTPDLKTIEDCSAKLSENKMIAAFCLIDQLEDPWHWFPCDFGPDGTVQYHELFPNAFREASEGKKGCIYTVEAEEEDIVPSGDIITVSRPKKALSVTECIETEDLFEWLMEQEDMGRFRLCTYEQKSKQDIFLWENNILRYLAKNKMSESPDCPYAEFVREKLPAVWEKYQKLCGK